MQSDSLHKYSLQSCMRFQVKENRVDFYVLKSIKNIQCFIEIGSITEEKGSLLMDANLFSSLTSLYRQGCITTNSNNEWPPQFMKLCEIEDLSKILNNTMSFFLISRKLLLEAFTTVTIILHSFNDSPNWTNFEISTSKSVKMKSILTWFCSKGSDNEGNRSKANFLIWVEEDSQCDESYFL